LSELQCAETDVIEGLVVEDDGLIGVFDQLVKGEGGVVRLHDHI
jgi:hypothetical protein